MARDHVNRKHHTGERSMVRWRRCVRAGLVECARVCLAAAACSHQELGHKAFGSKHAFDVHYLSIGQSSCCNKSCGLRWIRCVRLGPPPFDDGFDGTQTQARRHLLLTRSSQPGPVPIARVRCQFQFNPAQFRYLQATSSSSGGQRRWEN